jgi:hypothetical protein
VITSIWEVPEEYGKWIEHFLLSLFQLNITYIHGASKQRRGFSNKSTIPSKYALYQRALCSRGKQSEYGYDVDA